MKKYLTLLLIIFSLFINNYIFAGDFYEFKWSNTYVTVEKNDDISKYTSVPTAKLYRNGALMDDALISYNINGDWLYYLKDVDTTKVGEYKVWFKAKETKYNPGTCNNYKALVTFNVVDTKSHFEIIVHGTYDDTLRAKVIQVSVNSTKPDYIKESFIVIESDYEEDKNSVKVDDSNVNYQMPGIYKCIVYGIDHNKNKITIDFYVKVVDNISPTVNKIKDKIIIEKSNKEVDWYKYIKVEDNIVDKYKIELLNVDYNLIDIVQNCKLVVTDTHGNSTTINYDVVIVDSIKPVITLNNVDVIDLKLGEKYDEEFFKQFIDSALDGDVDLTNKVIIDISKVGNTVGHYYVYFSVTDSDNNMDMKELSVFVKGTQAPTIEVKEVTLNVGEKVDYKKFIKVTDPTDSDIMSKVNIDDTNVDYNNPGYYYVIVTVTNSSNLSSDDYIKVKIVKENKKIIIIKIIAGVSVVVIVVGSILYKRKKDNIEEFNLDN